MSDLDPMSPSPVTPPDPSPADLAAADASPSPAPAAAAAADPPADPDAAVPPGDFARELEDFDRGHPKPAAAQRVPSDLQAGTRVKGKVVSVGEEMILVDFGGRSEGAVETKHFRKEDGTIRVGVGDALDLFVVEAGDQILLAPSVRVGGRSGMRQVREAHTSGMPVSGKVTSVNAGGLAVDVGGVRGFCPLSQIEAGFCADPSVYVGRTLEFAVTKVEGGRGGAVLSRRQLLRRSEDAAAQQLMATLKPGDEREGTVARLEPFGAFIDLGGVDGLVHVSEIRHERIGHPREALTSGERVRVKVLKIEPGKDGKPRIALSIKAGQPDPWTGVEARFPRGTRVTGTVVRLTDFGAFVNLAPGLDGLVHVSEVAPHRVGHVKEVLTPGQAVEAMVLGVDSEKKRISLSIRATLPGVTPAEESGRQEFDRAAGGERPAVRRGERGGRWEVGEPEGRPAQGDRRGRSVRRDRTEVPEGEAGAERGERPESGERRVREGRYERVIIPAPRREEGEMTTMAIALRKAMERAKEKGKP